MITMNAEQQIVFHLQSYLSLSNKLGEDDPRVVDAFGKLRDLIIVEVYFMKAIRYLLKDEEMSGFVIYIDGDIKTMVHRYRENRGPFYPYLKETMEKRALSYLRDKMRIANIQRTCVDIQSSYSMAVAESPEEILSNREADAEYRHERKYNMKMLSYFCQQNPSRVKKLFVFLCTLMPFLSADVIDRFCSTLNCDRNQTLVISDCLDEIRKIYDKSRSSKAHMTKMINIHWAKIIENENLARLSLNPEKPKMMADFHRSKLNEVIKGFKKAKMNIPYRIVGKLVNLDPTTVGLYVMHSKHILNRVLKVQPSRSMLKSFKNDDKKLPRFEPFKEFGIESLNRSA